MREVVPVAQKKCCNIVRTKSCTNQAVIRSLSLDTSYEEKVCILYKLRQLESLQKLRPCSFFPKPKGKEGKNIKLSFRIWGNKNKDKNLLVCIPRNSFVNFLHSKTRKKKRTKIFLISKIMGLRECIKMHKAENLKPVYPAKMDKESLKTRTEV